MKRIVLFLATNLAIVLVLSVSMRLLGLEPFLTDAGLNPGSLLAFAAVLGFGIFGNQGLGIKRLFMTHPPLAERIAALRGRSV